MTVAHLQLGNRVEVNTVSVGWLVCPMPPYKCSFSFFSLFMNWASQVVLVVNNPCANVGDTGEGGSIPGSGRPPGEERGDPYQCSGLENLTDRGAWAATTHRVAESDTTERLCTHARPYFTKHSIQDSSSRINISLTQGLPCSHLSPIPGLLWFLNLWLYLEY